MKTLILSTRYQPTNSGSAIIAFNLANHLSPDDTVVLTTLYSSTKLNRAGAPRIRRGVFFWWPLTLVKIWRLVKKEKIEQIYLLDWFIFSRAVFWLNKFSKIPFVVFLRDSDWQKISDHHRYQTHFKKVCQKAAHLAVGCEEVKNHIQNKIEGLKNISTIYPCPHEKFSEKIDDVKLSNLRRALALDGKKVVITVADFTEGKGYPHAVRFLPEIIKKIPNLVWIFIGTGPKQKEIMDSISKNNLQNSVRFLGEINYLNLPAYYQIADLFVSLTHPDESKNLQWPQTILEAEACGLPVVSGRALGVDEVIQNLESGLIVDVHQNMGVISAISDILQKPEAAHALGARGQEMIKNKFNWPRQLDKLKI